MSSNDVRPIVDHVLPGYPPLDPARREGVLDDVARAVAEHLAHLPGPLRAGLSLGLAVAKVTPLPTPAPLALLVRSVALLHFYEHPVVRALLDPTGAEDDRR
jgi:hypothetical protein